MESLKILTANKLKVVAIAAMFFDHFADVFLNGGTDFPWVLLRIAGRTAAPVICFFIAEGYHYTSNRKKYLTRLLIFAVISHIPFNLYFGISLNPLSGTSIIWGLALGLVALSALKSEKILPILKPFILAACCALAWTANWNYIAVLWIVGFGLLRNSFKLQMLSFSAVGALFLLHQVVRPFMAGGDFRWFQLGIFLTIPLLMMYNGRLGKKSKLLSRSFYVFYPGHLILLYLIYII